MNDTGIREHASTSERLSTMAIKHKRLGKHGVIVGNICLGTMNFGWYAAQEESFKTMDRALELGINFFGTADVSGPGGEQGELEVIPACRYYGLGLIPWSPLGGGLLGGVLEKLEGGRRMSEESLQEIYKNRARLEQYEALCKELGEPPARRGLGLAFAQPHGDRAHHRPPNNRPIGIGPARHGNHSG
jgi:aryl-alcohol dehydrogenase-like predicted oxidoreductase